MGITLYIAEKPSAAQAIANGLGNSVRKDGYFDCGETLVSYCVGHLFEQCEPDHYLPDDVKKTGKGKKIWRAQDLPIVPDVWMSNPKKDTKSQLRVLGDLIKRSDEIVHAGDVDREGQAIVDDVIEHFKFRGSVKRFSVSAQDEVSIKRGLGDLKENADFEGWRLASQARQRADWLVGMNLTRSLTLAAQARGSQSLLVVGRVQSPTLALVVNRDEIIRNFKPQDYFLVDAVFSTQEGVEYTSRWIPPEDASYLDDEGRLTDGTLAEAVKADLQESGKGVITRYEKLPKSTPQPLGLSLSDITLKASNSFGMSADGVLKTVQSLYETHKLCSYPRSDCSYLPESQFADAPAIIDAIGATHPELAGLAKGANSATKSRIWNDKKITAHHAIVPTQKKGNYVALSDDEKLIYDLICRSYIAQFYGKYEFEATTIETTVGEHLLRTKGNTTVYLGWKSVYKDDDAREEDEQELPKLAEDVSVTVGECDVLSRKTKPPKHFTEGTLIKALENIYKYVDDENSKKLLKEEDGIGTPATRSSIISELKRRGYLELKGKNLLSTDAGQALVGTLPKAVTSAVLTAQYERQLKEIQNGNGSLEAFLESQIDYVTEQVSNAGEAVKSMPKVASEHSCECGGGLSRRKSQGGKGFWWGCSSYPECKKTYPDDKGKPNMSNKPANAGTETEHKCAKCEAPLIARKSAKGTTWYGCSGFPKCKERYFDKAGSPDYP